MSRSTRTFLTVAAGVVVGGVILVGLGALTGVIDVSGGSSGSEADNFQDTAVGEGDASGGERWCDSKKGERLAELGAVLLATEDPARVVELQDSIFELSGDAPPGAFCAVEELNGLITYWNEFGADSNAQKVKPREQVERVQKFQRDHKLDAIL